MDFTTRLAGVTFEDAQQNIKKFGKHEIGSYKLVREPNNIHDKNAIRVTLLGEYYMGYLPKALASLVSKRMDRGVKYKTKFMTCNMAPNCNTMGMTIKLEEN